ncbi:IPT/TIG domain-containing protein [Actinocrispum wychmicini]|uniref:IPT/TIG domain-containing protein n=1 Tax=Actinocrispum wychmicini TaxID=1213861 RepID=A0A4R2J813_9PSEU|nr:IPT/TIG domain-containing protein [Actinocrispum wychmicini]TCO54337.1 IPT/TIG domain-containing protein [Actinocrispum wychmicini]
MGPDKTRVLIILIAVVIIGVLLARYTKAVVGADKRVSTSKAVTLAWTLFVVWVFATLTVLEISTGAAVDSKPVADQYLLLLGGPFAALVAAKGIVTSRLANGTLQKSEGASPRAVDLVVNDRGSTDLVDLQFVLFNLVALLWAGAHFFQHQTEGLPVLPAGMVALTSVSALTYIGNKAVQSSTPYILSLTPPSAKVGDIVQITGTRLLPPHRPGDAVTPPTLLVAGLNVPTVGNSTETQMSFVVPAGLAANQDVDVTVSAGTELGGTGSATVKLRILP